MANTSCDRVDTNGNTVTMVGTVVGYNTGTKTLIVNVLGSNGPGASTTYSNWTIAIAPATAFIAADTINSSGLDTVSFAGPLAFSGNVTLNVAGSILINNGITATTLLPQGVLNPAGYSAPGCAGRQLHSLDRRRDRDAQGRLYPVCTENLSSGVVVVKPAKDGV